MTSNDTYLDYDLKSKDLVGAIEDYYQEFNRLDTLDHVRKCVEVAKTLKCSGQTILGCYLHDLGRVIPNEEAIDFLIHHEVTYLEKEANFPSILHQKSSRVIAEKVFHIKDEEILCAIEHHTTLKENPSKIDLEVFLCDKMSWDDLDYVEVAEAVKKDLEESQSLEVTAFRYLEKIHHERHTLKVYHPWTKEAYVYLKKKLRL